MMSPLEYLFVMMMKTNNPDANSLSNIEPTSGEAVAEDHNPIVINKNGHIEMRTILMQSEDPAQEILEVPLRITKDWVPMFKIGAPVSLRVDENGKTYNAKVDRIVTVKDGSGETVQAIAALARADAALKPGQTATAVLMPN